MANYDIMVWNMVGIAWISNMVIINKGGKQQMRKGKDKGCCQNKVVILSLSIMVMLIALALGANASVYCNLSIPSTNRLSADTNFNVSVNATNTAGNVSALFEIRATDTANSTFLIIGNQTNRTLNPQIVNMSLNASISDFVFEDSGLVSLRATCYENGTNGKEAASSSTTITGIIVDRTVPQTPTSLLPTGDDTSTQDKTFSATVVGANTTQCSLIFSGASPGYSSYAMTQSGDSCSLSLTNIPRGSYTYFIRASDGLNTSDSLTSSFSLSRSGSTAGARGYANYLIKTGQAQARTATSLSMQGKEQSQGGGFDFRKELTTPELIKTGIGAGIGAGIGLIGIVLGPGVIITVPIGAGIGAIIGMLV